MANLRHKQRFPLDRPLESAAFYRDRICEPEWEAGAVHLIGDRLAGDVIIVSLPPVGKCRILNIYWDPETEKAVFEYDDQPVS